MMDSAIGRNDEKERSHLVKGYSPAPVTPHVKVGLEAAEHKKSLLNDKDEVSNQGSVI